MIVSAMKGVNELYSDYIFVNLFIYTGFNTGRLESSVI